MLETNTALKRRDLEFQWWDCVCKLLYVIESIYDYGPYHGKY